MNPTNEELAKWCEARAEMDRLYASRAGPDSEDQRKWFTHCAEVHAAIASRLRIPEGHVALPGGEVVKVLGTLEFTEDNCLVASDCEVFYERETGSIRCWSVGTLLGQAPSGVVYSTPEAAAHADRAKEGA